MFGLAEPSSDLGSSGLIDMSRFELTKQTIVSATSALLQASSVDDITGLASTFSKAAAYLTGTCKNAHEQTKNTVAKTKFDEFSKALSAQASAVLAAAKALVDKISDDNRGACARASQQLLDTVQKLIIFASTDEFANSPASVSDAAREAMSPTLSLAQQAVASTCDMLAAGKVLMVDQSNAQLWQAFGGHSDSVGESLKSLVRLLKQQIPGRSACIRAGETVDMLLAEVEQNAALIAARKTLARSDATSQSVADQITSHIENASASVQHVATAAKSDAVILAHGVHSMLPKLRLASSCAPPSIHPHRLLLTSALAFAARVKVKSSQAAIVSLTKKALLGAQALLGACKDIAGNFRLTDLYSAVDNAADEAHVST